MFPSSQRDEFHRVAHETAKKWRMMQWFSGSRRSVSCRLTGAELRLVWLMCEGHAVQVVVVVHHTSKTEGTNITVCGV